jgi:hypothetical protein
LFATRQQGGICLNDSELSRLNVEQLQMISERSTGRRVSAWLLAFDSTTHFAFCGFLPQAKWLRLWLAIRLEALLPPKVPLSGGPCGAYLYTDNIFYVKLYMITINL